MNRNVMRGQGQALTDPVERRNLAFAFLRHEVAIDQKKIRPNQDAVGLSQRFFTSAGSATSGQLTRHARRLAILHYWTAKEAGLKAIGKGVDSSLDCFVTIPRNGRYIVEYIR